jgi:hypothetical protein
MVVFDVNDLVVIRRLLATLGVNTRNVVDTRQGWIELDVLGHVLFVVVIVGLDRVGDDALGRCGKVLFNGKVAILALAQEGVTVDGNIQHILTILAELHP